MAHLLLAAFLSSLFYFPADIPEIPSWINLNNFLRFYFGGTPRQIENITFYHAHVIFSTELKSLQIGNYEEDILQREQKVQRPQSQCILGVFKEQ